MEVKVCPLLTLELKLQFKLQAPASATNPSVFILFSHIPTVFLFALNKGMQAKAVETDHSKEEGHSVDQGSAGR